MVQTPTGQFSKEWPEPQRFPQFLDKMGKMMGGSYDWSADVKRLPMPVMLVFADNGPGASGMSTPSRCIACGPLSGQAQRDRTAALPNGARAPLEIVSCAC
jgi:hypothetical protein